MKHRHLYFAVILGAILAPLALGPAIMADAPALQVAPLQYTGSLQSGHASQGFIDVSNPADTTIQIQSSVKGFRQTGTNGDLQFFDSPELTSAITVDLDTFSLGPREAVRVFFTIDASKLPRGGVYAAIFFRTTVPAQSANTSYVVEQANVGTLLILNNGHPGPGHGEINLNLPFWQFGSGLHGALAFTNADHSPTATAIKPIFATRVLSWGRANSMPGGLVLPGYTRGFELSRPGSYLGPLPVTVADSVTRAHNTAWVFAVTGVYAWLVPLLALGAIVLHRLRHKRHQN